MTDHVTKTFVAAEPSRASGAARRSSAWTLPERARAWWERHKPAAAPLAG